MDEVGELDAVAALRRPSTFAGMPKGTETILLADDDDGVRTLAAGVLRSSGDTVLEAADGLEAIAMARRYAGVIHLLVSDIGMPHMTGRELAEVLCAERPELRTLFVSGHAAESCGPAPGVTEHWLAKPFAPMMLAVTVRDILNPR